MLSTDQAQSVSVRIAQRVKRLPKGQPFSISRFTGFGTKNAVSKAIVRLVKRGELERVYRGIYMRPKPGLYVARARPNLWQLISVIARQKHLSLQIHGANAVRRFGLSTQMPLIPIFYTNGASRSVFIGNAEIRLIRATPMVMQHAGTEIGMAISALYYLGKEGSTPECITAIKKELRPEDFVKLLACKLPKWMSTVLKV
ncbi:TPA: type IV toxin-antitoxin system AbiEi family antitoxin domain-containing protein [Pseudomonas aeruginosa]|nr:type IV toxin-antitoxin system AbiEi family antitoxin domain-containing protein [Pseudomonas aeruginosa]